jgi:ethanolamine ammonia-lyase small subunit
MATPPALWRDLQRFTPARIALGRVGAGLPTDAHLRFQAAHAAARDAVHAELDVAALQAELQAAGYLLRPDLGRSLDIADRGRLAAAPMPGSIAFVVCDGLSAVAAQRHAAALLGQVIGALDQPRCVVIARQGRVALGDEIGGALQAEAVAVLIGERPGLSAPDSLGVYLTWQPQPGRTDAERNCISNIRAEGLPVDQAAAKLLWLIGAMRRLRLTGVGLKDEQPALPPPEATRLPRPTGDEG